MGSLKSSEVGGLGTFKTAGDPSGIPNADTYNNTSLIVKCHDLSNIKCIDEISIQPKMDSALIPSQVHHHHQQQQHDEEGVVENSNQSAAAAEHSLWEFFAHQLEEGDFMVSSPVRNLPPVPSQPSSSSFANHNHNHLSCIHNGDDDGSGNHSLINYDDHDAQHPIPMGCSPCPSPPPAHNTMMSLLSPLRSPITQPYNNPTNNTNYYSGVYKAGNSSMKGMSPIHRVLMNSPTNQYMEIESLSLPALQFLDDLDKDDNEAGGIASPQDCFDFSSVPELLDCLIMPDPSADNSRFCGSHLSSTQESSSNNDITSVSYPMTPCSNGAPLLQQLQQERQHEKQQQRKQQQQHHHHQTHHQHQHQHQNMTGSTLTVPLSFGPDQEQDSGLRLVHLLLACAEAVAKEDYMLARRYLHHLNRVVTPLGDSMQRVASCFAEALGARLAATLTAASKLTNISTTTATSSSSSVPRPFTPFSPNSLEILKIYQIVYQACPYIKFAHFTANQAIFEAFEAEERVHVIDLDILQGYQWPAFMQALAARPGGAPFLRITGVGPCPEGVRETGRCLTELAHSLHIPFEFHPVAELLEDLKPHMFNRRVGEALAVNSVNRLHRVPTSSLGNLLGMIRDQAPNIVTIVEQEASHNGPYFLGRFLEALHYYSAIFDSLDATFPPDSAQRAKVEQYIFAPEIRNIVAHEGLERTARHERLDKWRKIMEGKGFKGVPLSTNAVTQSKILLGLYPCDGYRLTEDKGCLLLGWQDRAILAASAWRC